MRSSMYKMVRSVVGKTFGNLVVLGIDPEYRGGGFVCRCSCGKEFTTEFQNLLRESPMTKCRSCISKDTIKVAHEATVIHGEAQKTRLYGIWGAMLNRCRNPKAAYYNRYGGRGIQVCDFWKTYVNFRDWALTSGYSEELQIDRIDNDLGYEPSNCRWVTSKEQQNNRGNAVRIETPDGDLLTMFELSERTGIKAGTLYERRRLHPDISYKKLIKPTKGG